MQALMWENGLIHARMTKARLLHSFLCKLVGETLSLEFLQSTKTLRMWQL